MEPKEDQIQEFEESLTFGQQFNFKEIYRVRGVAGLFFPRSRVNVSGMVAMGGFLQPDIGVTVKANQIVCLDWYDFITTEEHERGGFNVIKMNQVFDNIFNYIKESNDDKLEKVTIEQLMDIMVPLYDQHQFKDYHAKQIKGWYLHIVEVLTKATKQSNEDI